MGAGNTSLFFCFFVTSQFQVFSDHTVLTARSSQEEAMFLKACAGICAVGISVMAVCAVLQPQGQREFACRAEALEAEARASLASWEQRCTNAETKLGTFEQRLNTELGSVAEAHTEIRKQIEEANSHFEEIASSIKSLSDKFESNPLARMLGTTDKRRQQ